MSRLPILLFLIVIMAALACSSSSAPPTRTPKMSSAQSAKATQTMAAIMTRDFVPTRKTSSASDSNVGTAPAQTTAPAPTALPAKAATNTPQPQIVADTPPPLPTELSAPTPTSEPLYLPGITPSDVKVNLENRGLECGAASQFDLNGATHYMWRCQRDDGDVRLDVSFDSRSLLTVDTINASVSQFGEQSSDTAASFLGFVATLPFIGSNQDQAAATAWVEATIPQLSGQPGDVRTTTIAGIDMVLFGPPGALTFQIGNVDTAPTTPQPSAQLTPTSSFANCDCSADIYNCSSFTLFDAQACLNHCIATGAGDVHGLDKNNNGIACEENR